MSASYKQYTDFLIELGIEKVSHSTKTYLSHLVNVYRLMEAQGCSEEVCRAGMFHSIYGTEVFQGFKLPLHSRAQVRQLIGTRAEGLAYLNCALDRTAFDETIQQTSGPYHVVDRITQEKVAMSPEDFDDLCRVHLYDWLEQAPRSRLGWNYRRSAYRRMAERLGEEAVQALERVYAAEGSGTGEALVSAASVTE